MPDPEPMLDGVWRLRGTRGCNVYAVRLASGGVALVDTGLPGNLEVIRSGLERLGSPRVEALLLTHAHPDHAGSAAALREALDARVVAGAGDVRDGDVRPPEGRRRPRPRRMFEAVRADLAVPMDRECEVASGVVAIPSPGHTPGSVCYLLAERDLLFIGDVAIRSPDRMSRPLPISNSDTAEQERSLAMVAAQAPSNGAAGHGDPWLGGFDAAMRELAARPPAPGPWWLRVVLNPREMLRFARGQAGRRR